MEVIAFIPEDFKQLQDIRLRLHNAMRAITFDEQRDLAETLRLLLERAEPIETPE
jgi:hypothetical protein